MTNKTKPVEWDKDFDKMFVYEPNIGRVLYRPSPLLVPIPYIKDFISSLLQEQAEHFVELGEGLRKKPDEEALRLRGMDRMSERYLSASVEAVKFHGYNQGVSDFQEAIKNDKK